MQKTLGNDTLTWENLAEYCRYLRGFYIAGSEAIQQRRFGKDDKFFNIMLEEIKYDSMNAEENIRQQSIFEMMIDHRYNRNNLFGYQKGLKDDLTNFK